MRRLLPAPQHGSPAIDAAGLGAYHGAMTRLRSDFWVSAHLRRLNDAGMPAVLRRRGAAEAGAIFVKVDRLDGSADLFGPAPQALFEAQDSGERRFSRVLSAVPSFEVEERLTRELRFDSDLWIVEIDDAQDRHALPLAE